MGSHAGPQDFQIANNPGANYSNSNFDVRQAFKGYAVYMLPFARPEVPDTNRLVDGVIGGCRFPARSFCLPEIRSL